jgi:uncharacterized membrane protein HdeD (DUF308 family)
MNEYADTAKNVVGEIKGELKRASGWYIALGVVLILGGVFAVLRPLAAGYALTVVVGWLLIIGGGMFLINSFMARGAGGFFWRLLLSALYVVAGIIVLMNPFEGLGALTIILALVIGAGGVFRLLLASALKGVPGVGLLIFSGLVAIALAILILAKWPESSQVVLGVVVGIDFIFNGMSILGVALNARQLVSD